MSVKVEKATKQVDKATKQTKVDLDTDESSEGYETGQTITFLRKSYPTKKLNKLCLDC